MFLEELKRRNGKWFSPENKRFFGDVRYTAHYGGKSGDRFLVRSTYAFTDMFRAEDRRLHYRVNRIEEDFSIGDLLPEEFGTLAEVRRFLKNA